MAWAACASYRNQWTVGRGRQYNTRLMVSVLVFHLVVWWVRCVALCPTWYMCQGLPLVLGFFFLSPAATTAVASSSSFGSLGSFALST